MHVMTLYSNPECPQSHRVRIVLGEKDLTEDDYRNLIQEEYTFLKRPVFLVADQIFIGNSKKVIEELKTVL